jgi:cytochrome b561
MSPRLHYGTTAKVFHWLIVGLLIVQYLIGWLMPNIHRGQQPGAGMTLHVSVGISIMVLIILRLIWRLTHPVAPESSLPPWQRLSSELVHWMLYILVLATTLSGWLFASFRGWTVFYFYVFRLPTLSGESVAAGKAIDGLHQAAEWTLLVLIGLHVLAAFTHIFIYRDHVMQRMLPGRLYRSLGSVLPQGR